MSIVAVGRAWPHADSGGGRHLRIATATDATSLDPQLQYFGPDRQVHHHMFETLLWPDERMRLQPGLAWSWHLVDDRSWAFRLRPGVTWHDGAPFTADDVVFSLDRAPNVPDSASSLGMFTQSIERVETPDPLTVIVRTKAAAPLLPQELASVFIVSRHRGQGATTADYNLGAPVVGTGPYRLVEWQQGSHLILSAFADHWGGAPEWDTVRLDVVPDGASRMQALLSGAADLVDQVPPDAAGAPHGMAGGSIAACVSNFLLYLSLDQFRATSPWITAKGGGDIANPLRDRSVRIALSMAIDRDFLASEVMLGSADPADQLLPEAFPGYDPAWVLEVYDPIGARRLLAKAGYPNGFRMVLHGTSDRYMKDGPLLQAIARGWQKIGLDVTVQSLPFHQFFPRASKGSNGLPEFSVTQVGWGAPTGEVSSTLKGLLATYDGSIRFGTANRGRYSNPAMDGLLVEALHAADEPHRIRLLQEATRLSVGADRAIIPLVYPRNMWAAGPGIAYTARADGLTSAMDARSTHDV